MFQFSCSCLLTVPTMDVFLERNSVVASLFFRFFSFALDLIFAGGLLMCLGLFTSSSPELTSAVRLDSETRRGLEGLRTRLSTTTSAPVLSWEEETCSVFPLVFLSHSEYVLDLGVVPGPGD